MPRRPSLISRIRAAQSAPVEPVEAPVEQFVEPVEAPVEQLVEPVEAPVEAPVEQPVEVVRIRGDIHASVGRLYRRFAADDAEPEQLADIMASSLYAHAAQLGAAPPAPPVFGLDDPTVAAFVEGVIGANVRAGRMSYGDAVDAAWRFLFAALVYAENLDPDEDGNVSRPV